MSYTVLTLLQSASLSVSTAMSATWAQAAGSRHLSETSRSGRTEARSAASC